MAKIMIVDDEVLIRNHLKYIITSELPGISGEVPYTLCGEASDGKECLEKIKECSPDIVLSDMKMPVMDGLELCGNLHRNYPRIQFIALSNYDDFEYVRGTLQNGAVDYMLKHKMSPETLLGILNKASAHLKISPLEDPDALNANSLNALKREFLIHLLTGLYSDPKEISARLNSLGIELDPEKVLPVVMCVDDYQAMDLKNSSLLQFSIVNIISEILADRKKGAVLHISNEKYALLFSFAGVYSRKNIFDSIHSFINQISFCMEKFLNISVSFCIGDLCEDILSLPQSYHLAEDKMKNKFYYYSETVFAKEHTESKNENVLEYFNIEKEVELTNLIESQDTEKIHVLLKDLFSVIRTNKPPLVISQMVFTDLLELINQVCKKHAVDVYKIYDGNLSERQLRDFTSLSSVQRYFFMLFDKVCLSLRSHSTAEHSVYVKQALEYINTHFTENISQSLAAEKIGISNVYLSKLFNQEMKIGFSEYLVQVRLNQAEKLLRQRKLSIREIAAQCGFNDYVYFLKTFKKHVGVTPHEYLGAQ